MKDSLSHIRDSGILEQYVLGIASKEEQQQVEAWLEQRADIQAEVRAIESTLELYAQARAVAPPAHLKAQLLTQLEAEVYPPLEQETSLDFWLPLTKDLPIPEEGEDIYVHRLDDPIYHTRIVRVHQQIPEETHHNLLERFLLLQGTCTCRMGEQVFEMKPGDLMEIPLHLPHSLTVTSKEPNLFILQRVKVA